MINITDNTCPICLTDNLFWNINYSKSDVEIFKCGHGTCKECYQEIKKDFKCCLCREVGQEHRISFESESNKWNTFNEWYSEFEIYIMSGVAQNIIDNSSFGKQLKRLFKKARRHSP